MDRAYKRSKQSKPTRVEDHPETTMPPRMNQVNDIYSPPDPSQAIQGPQAPGSNALY